MLQRFALERHQRHFGYELTDIAAAATGVAMQGTAERSGNSDERFETGETCLDRAGDQLREECAGLGTNGVTGHVNLGKRLVDKANHHSGNPLFTNEEIRAAAEYSQRNPLFVTHPHDGDQLVLMARLDEVLRRPPYAKPCKRGKRYITLCDLAKVVE